jgi:hypothetical protein
MALMGWLLSNWVERRAAREQNLRSASEVWKKVQSALAATCDSLKKYYSGVATIQRTHLSNDVLAITVARKIPPGGETASATNVIVVEFQAQTPSIVATVDGDSIQEFAIKADSDHTFLTFEENEIVLDEFSQLVLEEVFFRPSVYAQRSPKLKLVK